MQKIISFEKLKDSHLYLDALYKGGSKGNAGDDPISKLLNCGNQGGFRYSGSINPPKFNYVILYSSSVDPDWPDTLDLQMGRFTYYGDNKKPGSEIHDTPRKGNIILRDCFNQLHSGVRFSIPPFFVFNKAMNGRDVIFRGLAVPGASGVSSTEDLVAVWKITDRQRFQNYRAMFSILDVSVVSREWINDLQAGNPYSKNTPEVWLDWVERGVYKPLTAQKSVEHRTKEEQWPQNQIDIEIIQTIYNYFEDGYAFEFCAVEIIKLLDQKIISCDLTRPWVDGGRDALGKYRIGLEANAITVDFALEVKRYELGNAVGVRETSRLISRLRNRQFGILLTTSYVHHNAYKEIKEDGHPVIIVCARDIVEVLRTAGINTKEMVTSWLEANFCKSIK